MLWDLPAIAGFAQQGGFRREELAEAMAVAVVASQGDDALVDAPMFGDLPPTCGLWQVPASNRMGFDIDALLVASTNARAAHTLWKEAGQSWAWSPAYRSGRWQAVIDNAWEVVRSGRRTQQAASLRPRDRLADSGAALAGSARLTTGQLAGLARVLRDATPR